MKIFTAPVAGVTDSSFRKILREFHPDMIFTEMVSSNAIVMNNQKTHNEILDDIDGDSVQIFGKDIDVMVESAKFLEKIGVNHIDINMGCPVPKVVKNGYGAALLKDINHIDKLVGSIRDNINTKISLKIRIGYKSFKDPISVAKIADKYNLDFITVHGRSREQMYSGKANWDIIKEIKNTISIPVIGNGDIFSAEDALEKANFSGVDGIMVARGMFGNPWIIKQIREIFENGFISELPSKQDRIDMSIKHYNYVIDKLGEKKAVFEMRKHLCWYIKGLHNSIPLKNKINTLNEVRDVFDLLEKFRNED